MEQWEVWGWKASRKNWGTPASPGGSAVPLAPSGIAPSPALPGQQRGGVVVLLCPTGSYCVLLCPAVPSHIQPCPAVSCSAQPCQPRTAGWCSPQGFNLCCTRGIKDLVA